MKISDLIAEILKKNSIKNVFGLQGGAVVHIFDSLIKKKINVTFTHHEESAALAAVSNAKSTNELGCAVVTTGPGSTNAITGLLAAWQDSVPVIFVSGQARSIHTSYGKKVRQVGTQEVNICDIVKPITKYTKFINSKNNILTEFTKAIKIAKSGRPGPVWLDVALDVQWKEINKKYSLKKISIKNKFPPQKKKFDNAIIKINKSKKPLFVIGGGIKNSNYSVKKLKKFLISKNIPCVLTWNSFDIFETNFKYNLGIIGMNGHRGANKAMFDSDLLICLGTHLPIPQTTTLYKNFAPKSKKIIVNIDKEEIKNLNVKFDLKILQDLNYYLNYIEQKIKIKNNYELFKYKNLNWYKSIEKKNRPNSNNFIHNLTNKVKSKTCFVIDGGGTALYAGFQSSIIKNENKIICSSSVSSMGTGLAESIGVAKSNCFKKIFCIIGDGSFLMNCQDLQTISQDKLNICVILINNNGYLAIRNTQKEFLNKRYFGTLPPKGISFPNFKKLSKSFNINYKKISSINNANFFTDNINNIKGPLIVDLIVDENQESLFKQGYIKNNNNTFSPMNLSEMYPFVSKPISNTNN